MLIGGELGYRLLRRFPVPRSWQARLTRSAPPQPGKLEAYWGPGIWEELAGRTVIWLSPPRTSPKRVAPSVQ